MDRFMRFHDVIDKHMPDIGEGETMMSQACTACNKLVYKWFNDGDVYDNTRHMEGWCNDISSYANWLYTYVPETREPLTRIYDCRYEAHYEDILYSVCEAALDETEHRLASEPKVGSIYECDGPFRFEEYEEVDDDWWYDGWSDEEDDEDDEC